MDRYIKQIQTRINRRLTSRGQTVTKQQVRDVYLTVVKNSDKPTDIEISRVVELIAKQLSAQEEVTQDKQITASENTALQEPAIIKITRKDHPDLWETLQPPTDEQPQELALKTTETSQPTHQPETAEATGISQASIEQAIELAIAQTGAEGSTEAKEIMTQLALHLKSDINTLEQAVTALVTGYLNKRSNLLKNAIGTLNTLRNAQTNSFCSGLTPDFLAKQETAKKQLMEIANSFN
jgi:hypothetical protein